MGHHKQSENKKWVKFLIYCTFILYCYIVLHIVLLSRARMFHADAWAEIWAGRRLQYGVNLIPFKTISGYIRSIMRGNIITIAIRNLAGNLFMFLPLGIYLPIIWKKCRKMKNSLLVSLIILISIEIMQFITLMGSLDIDDLILNICGVLIGYGLWKGIKIIQYFNL